MNKRLQPIFVLPVVLAFVTPCALPAGLIVEGRVLDPAGKAVPGAEVRLTDPAGKTRY